MPTRKQMWRLWESEFEFKYGHSKSIRMIQINRSKKIRKILKKIRNYLN